VACNAQPHLVHLRIEALQHMTSSSATQHTEWFAMRSRNWFTCK
jgi:hypothetical protein